MPAAHDPQHSPRMAASDQGSRRMGDASEHKTTETVLDDVPVRLVVRSQIPFSGTRLTRSFSNLSHFPSSFSRCHLVPLFSYLTIHRHAPHFFIDVQQSCAKAGYHSTATGPHQLRQAIAPVVSPQGGQDYRHVTSWRAKCCSCAFSV